MQTLEEFDPALAEAIDLEKRRERNNMELIASENYVSRAVLEAQGSVLTNKYAEGYPGRRYYGGCEYVDLVEQLAIERAKKVFGAEHANVQPHSGSQANMGAYLAVLKPGDKILGMSLANGGHLTHGSKVSFSGALYEAYHYGVDPETETINYDHVAELALEHKPRLIICGASAYSRTLDFQRMRQIADLVGAYLLADIAHISGLVATGLHPSPFPHAHLVTTSTHKTLRGPRGGMILCGKELAQAVDRGVFPGMQGGPLMHVIAAKAVAFQEALQPSFTAYQKQVVANAKTLAAEVAAQGLRIVSGGTDNHLMLVDLRSTGLTGKDVQLLLDSVGITANKNAIPNDEQPPNLTSGIRLGTPAVTTRGFGEPEMVQIAEIVGETIRKRGDERAYDSLRQKVREICDRFPVPGID